MPAADSVPNLFKYAFNMIGSGPGQAAALTTPNSRSVGASGTAGLPFVNTDANGRLTVTYIRRKPAPAPGITYAVEFSSDLINGPWAANASATESVTTIDATFERVTVTDSVTGATTRFVRVKVSAL
jgi:hypothetical protein